MSQDLKNVVIFIAGFTAFFVTVLGGGIFMTGMMGPVTNSSMAIGMLYMGFGFIIFFVPILIVFCSALGAKAAAK